MKRILTGIALVAATAALVVYAFREPITGVVSEQLTADMFVAADTDAFDPGPAIGSPFPLINALREGRTENTVTPFMATTGLLFIANRSVEW